MSPFGRNSDEDAEKSDSFIDEIINKYKEGKRKTEEKYSPEISEERVFELVKKAEGSSVTELRLTASINIGGDTTTIVDRLDQQEQPHHIIHGKSVDIEGSGDSNEKSSIGADRCRTVITNKRIFIVIGQMISDDIRNIPYDSITGVDVDTGMINKRLSIQTHGRTYHISALETSHQTCYDSMEYIRQQRDRANGFSEDRNDPENQNSPLDKLDKLQELSEKGAITDTEFEEKKRDLLDKV